MKKTSILKSTFILIICALMSSVLAATPLQKVRIGWQVPWATQGQLVQIWKHTDILKKNGLEAEFIGKTFGPQLNELALAGAIDVILTADQPAATLFSKDKGWVGIGRLMYNRTSLYTAPNSPIKNVKDLKGKTIGVPVGAAAERTTIEALKREGIDTQKEITLINLDIREQGALIVSNKEKEKWGQFDALSGFDPLPAILESQKLVRVLDTGKVVSLVLMNQELITKSPTLPVQILKALSEAYNYYRLNKAQANEWFIKEAQLANADQNACEIAASLEPNLKVKKETEIRVAFTNEDFELMQKGADFVEQKIGKKINMKNFVNNTYTDLLKAKK